MIHICSQSNKRNCCRDTKNERDTKDKDVRGTMDTSGTKDTWKGYKKAPRTPKTAWCISYEHATYGHKKYQYSGYCTNNR